MGEVNEAGGREEGGGRRRGLEVGGCMEASRVVREAVWLHGGYILPLPSPPPAIPSTDAIKVDGGCHPPPRLGSREVTFGTRRRRPPLCNVCVETCMCRPSGGTVKPGTGRRTDAGLMGLAGERCTEGRAVAGNHMDVPGAHGSLEKYLLRTHEPHGRRIWRYVL